MNSKKRKVTIASAIAAAGLAAGAGLFITGNASADTVRDCPAGPFAQFIISVGPSGQQSAINMRNPVESGSNCIYQVDHVEFAGPGGTFIENVSSVVLSQNTNYPLSTF